jgi:carbon storage regulator
MLVLSRKTKEKILIGKDIVISVLEIEGNSVKIGIKASKDISILRMEVFEKIQNENIASASKEPEDISKAMDLFKKKLLKE